MSTSLEQEHVARRELLKLAFWATLLCLAGCGLGKLVGTSAASLLSLSLFGRLALEVVLAFGFGLALGIIPLVKGGLPFRFSARAVLGADGLSIAAMETAEVTFELLAMALAGGTTMAGSHWYMSLASVPVGFVAAFPVNYVLVRKGIRAAHQHGRAEEKHETPD